MSVLTATSIARVQVMAARLQPEPPPPSKASSLLSDSDLEDLAAVKALQRSVISEPPRAQARRPEAPIRLFIHDGQIAFGGFRQGDSRGPASLAALIYASHQLDPAEGTRSLVMDLLV